MRTILSILLISGFMGPALAQDFNPETYEVKRNIIKLSPWQLLGGIFEVSYERTINNGKSSFQVMPALTLRQPNDGFSSRFTEYRGIECMAQYRFYYMGNRALSRPAYKSTRGRLYVAPYYRTKYLQANYVQDIGFGEFEFSGGNSFQDQSLSHEAGFIAGVQVLSWDRFSFDLYTGGGVRYSQLVSNNPFEKAIRNNNLFNTAYTGVVPRINFTLGIAF